tara:strand:- start:425 stop:706 length:282 start_codon:yes stop_codon:yes gene_type:complete
MGDSLLEILFLLSVIASALSCGFILAYLVQLRQLRTEMQEKIAEFDRITKAASAANLSQAEKLMQIDAKIDNMDAWRSMMVSTTSQQSSGWKK